MPIYRPEHSPRVNPYGGLKDITPEGMEALFLSSKGGVPSNPPLNYKFTVGGRYKLRVWFGNTGFPKTLYLYVSNDGGESWQQNPFTFPSDYEVDANSVSIDSEHESDTLYLQATTLDGVTRPTLETWISENNGTTWNHLRTLSEPGFFYGTDTIVTPGHRIFPTSRGVYQVSGLISEAGPPYETKIVGYKDGAKTVDHTTSPLISNGSISVSHYARKQETGFFGVNFNSFLGGQEIWKVSGNNGIELRGKLPESEFTIPMTDTRPFLQQLWYLPRKGVLYVPTLVSTGARLYTSFDEGATWSEQPGGIRIGIPELSTLGRRGLVDSPVTGDRFRNEGYMQDLADSVPFDDILDEFSDGTTWHIGFQSRLTRRQSKFYLWQMPNP